MHRKSKPINPNAQHYPIGSPFARRARGMGHRRGGSFRHHNTSMQPARRGWRPLNPLAGLELGLSRGRRLRRRMLLRGMRRRERMIRRLERHDMEEAPRPIKPKRRMRPHAGEFARSMRLRRRMRQMRRHGYPQAYPNRGHRSRRSHAAPTKIGMPFRA